MSLVTVECVETIRDVEASEWNALVPDMSVSLTHEWLSSLENAPIRCRYFLAFDEGSLVGALPTYVWDGFTFAVNHYDPFEAAVSGDRAPAGRRDAWFPALLLGARNGTTTQILLRRERLELLAALVAAAYEWGAAERARSSAFMHLDPAARAAVERLELQRLVTVALVPETRLALSPEWTSFDDYVAILPKNRRTSVRRERREWRCAGAEVTRARLSEHCDSLGPLLANVERKHGKPTPAAACTAWLREKAASLDACSTVFLCTRGDDVVGFSLVYRHGAAAYAGATGFDYELARDVPFAYFNTLFYEPIVWAIETGVRELYFGREAYESKLARGAVLSERWGALIPPHEVETPRSPILVSRPTRAQEAPPAARAPSLAARSRR